MDVYWSGSQLRLGLMEEGKKETLFEDLWAFTGLLPLYFFRRARSVLGFLFRAAFSGFSLTGQFKVWLSRLFIRRKGQLSFPFAHATLVGVSLTILIATAGLGSFIFNKPKTSSPSLNPFILESTAALTTEESDLLVNKVRTHIVEEEENIYQIAEIYGIPADALTSANRLPFPYTLKEGQELTIPPFQLEIYEVKSPITVESVAKLFGAQSQDIIDFNYLFDENGVYWLREIGQLIQIPTYQGGYLSWAPPPKGECKDPGLIWPTLASRKLITQRWKPWHSGVDIDTNRDPLFAAASGTISVINPESGGSVSSFFWNNGNGGMVVLDIDGTGWRLIYKHLSRIDVRPGDKVSPGQAIGISGDTGKSTGDHLHFEVHCNGVVTDPLYYLPR